MGRYGAFGFFAFYAGQIFFYGSSLVVLLGDFLRGLIMNSWVI